MPDIITRNEPIREVPQKAGGAVLTARFTLAREVDLPRTVIVQAANASLPAIRLVMRLKTFEAYRASGLRVISGTLLREATTRFTARIFLRGRNLVVEFEWNPTIRYFFIHLFGGVITPRRARALVFQIGDKTIFTQSVTIPARPFLRFDREARQEIQRILNDAIAAAMVAIRVEAPPPPAPAAIAPRPQRPPPRRPRERRIEELVRRAARAPRAPRAPSAPTAPPTRAIPLGPSGRLTPFRVRKAFRRPLGPLTAAESRQLQKLFAEIGLSTLFIKEFLGLRRGELVELRESFQLLLR